MDAAQRNFLILNGAVVTLVVLSFMFLRRSPKPPVQLDLRDDDQIASDEAREAKKTAEETTGKPRPKFTDPRLKKDSTLPTGWGDYQPRQRKVYGGAVNTTPASPEIKALNVLFNWNGHTWDAYEVLGVPAGSSLESAKTAFERAATRADAETVPFLKAAYDAIARG